MSYFADPEVLGVFPAQHHGLGPGGVEYDDACRILLTAARVTIDPRKGPVFEDATYGQVVGWRLWQTKSQTKTPRRWHLSAAAGSVDSTGKIEAVKGPKWEDLEQGLEAAPSETPYGIKLPVGSPALQMTGLDMAEQHELSAPVFFGLVAPHFEGDAKMGTRVFDLDKDNRVDEDRYAHVQSFWRVWKQGGVVARSKAKGQPPDPGSLAWQIGLARGGFPGHGVVAEVGGPQQQLGTVSHLLGGPFKTVPKSDQHSYFESDKGEAGAPVHIDTRTIFHGNGGDGPWDFGGEYTPCISGPLLTESYIRFNSEVLHEWVGGSGVGRWMVQGSGFFAIIEKPDPYDDLIPRFNPRLREGPDQRRIVEPLTGGRPQSGGGLFSLGGGGGFNINIGVQVGGAGGGGPKVGVEVGQTIVEVVPPTGIPTPNPEPRPGAPTNPNPPTGGGLLTPDPLGLDDPVPPTGPPRDPADDDVIDRGEYLSAGPGCPMIFEEPPGPRPLAGSVTEIAMPALVFRAQHFEEGQTDLRSIGAPCYQGDPLAQVAWAEQPAVGRWEAMAPQLAGGFDLTTEAGDGRYEVVPTAPGVITLFPPELGHEQIGFAEGGLSISEVCLNMYSDWVKLSWGTPDPSTGLVLSGYSMGLSEETGYLQVNALSEAGAATGVMEFVAGGGVCAEGWICTPTYTQTVINDSGGLLAGGEVVTITGASSGVAQVDVTSGASDLPLGIVRTLTGDGETMEVVTEGYFDLSGILDTSTASFGDPVYYVVSTGALTLTAGSIQVGIVIVVSSGSGAMQVFMGGAGDVQGPASSTDNAIARFDGTTGKLIQGSTVMISDAGEMAGVGQIAQGNQIAAVGAAGLGVWWTKSDTPTNPYYTDSGSTSHSLVMAPSSFTTADLLLGSSVPGRPTRLAVGTQYQVLRAGSSAPEYAWQGVIDRSVTYYTTAGSTSTRFPIDGTTPQSSEGAEVTTVAHTAKHADNIVKVRVIMHAGLSGGNSPSWGIGLFLDSGASAVRSQWVASVANYAVVNVLEYEAAAGDTSSHTYKLRAGPNSASDSLRWNQIVSSGGELLNDTPAIVIEITEYAP